MTVQTATVYRQLRIPAELTSIEEATGIRYGGDIRIGDLTGNGEVDFVVYQALGGIKPAFVGAFDLNGQPLWSFGDRDLSVRDVDGAGDLCTISPDRPGPVAVADVDGDGSTEVLCLFVDEKIESSSKWHLDDVRVIVLDGVTGQIKKQEAPTALRNCDGFSNGELRIPNYVHQRLLIADLTGGGPRDFVMKLGETILACSCELEVLWTYRSPWNEYPHHAAYIPCVGDIDGDGRDEVVGGHFCLDHDGTPLWERYLGDNMDSVVIEDWLSAPGEQQAIVSAGGRVLDRWGNEILAMGMEEVPHGQEIRCGRYHGGEAELAIRYNGHHPDLIVVGHDGGIRSRFEVDESPNNTGLETIRWNGAQGPDFIYSPAALWDGDGNRRVVFPDLPPASGGKMGWYHCFPADVRGDGREAVILYDPYQDLVHIYTADEPDGVACAGYRHTPRQYNTRLID